MRQVNTKVICGAVIATFLCAACHADGLTKDQVRELLLENNHHLESAMEQNTETLNRTMEQNAESLGKTMRDNTGLLHKTMKENTEILDRTISEGTNKIIAAIAENNAILSKNLTEAIDKLGTHLPGPLPEAPAPIYVHKTVRHVYVHKYIPCCRVIWEEYPCCWPW